MMTGTRRTRLLLTFFLLIAISSAYASVPYISDSVPCWNTKTKYLKGVTNRDDSNIVVIGDIHGQAGGLLEVLYAANLTVSSTSCQWQLATQNVLVVQMGDVVDRGPKSTDAWDCLAYLQSTAREGVKLVRLTGNHELLWLGHEFDYSNRVTDTVDIRNELVKKIRNDIYQSNVLGAFYTTFNDIPVIFSHAGFRTGMLQFLQSRGDFSSAIAASRSANDKMNNHGLAHTLAKYVNSKLKNIVSKCIREFDLQPLGVAAAAGEGGGREERRDVSKKFVCSFWGYALFGAGPERGGKGIGGPFWTDFSVLEAQDSRSTIIGGDANGNVTAVAVPSPDAPPFLQVVGHTVQQDKRIHYTSNLYNICVDVGIYAGGRAFLTFDVETGLISAHENVGNTGWTVRDLTTAACMS